MAGAVVVMTEAIAYARDPEQDAKDYEEWAMGTMGEVLTRELEDLRTEEAAAAAGSAAGPMEVDEEEEVEVVEVEEEVEKEGGDGSEGEVEMVMELAEDERGRLEVRS